MEETVRDGIPDFVVKVAEVFVRSADGNGKKATSHLLTLLHTLKCNLEAIKSFLRPDPGLKEVWEN